MTTHSSSLAMRVLGGALVAAALMVAVTAAAAAADPIGSDTFAADWQAHSRGLINAGPGPTLSTTAWYVPAILPRGRYVLIERDGDKARLIDGYQFEVTSAVNREIKLWVPNGYGNVEAIPVADVPALAAPRNDRKGQL